MAEMIPTIVFYVFASVALLSAVRVISAKNPVHSVLFLILSFFSTAGLFVLLGAEYIAMTLIIVYVGAVAVLFLFVVMMLDIDIAAMREGFLRYLPVGILVALVVFAELFLVFSMSLNHPSKMAAVNQAIPGSAEISNTEAIGNVLYTYYIYPFQMSGVILLIAMIGAIVLTLRTRSGVRKQKISKQLARTAADGMEIVKVESGKGIG
jgi:NADH-quinone oxidoreductase subunit J